MSRRFSTWHNDQFITVTEIRPWLWRWATYEKYSTQPGGRRPIGPVRFTGHAITQPGAYRKARRATTWKKPWERRPHPRPSTPRSPERSLR